MAATVGPANPFLLKVAPVPRLSRNNRSRRLARRAAGPSPRPGSLPQLAPVPESNLERLIRELLPLVRRIALKVRRSLPANVEVDDLIGAGSLGLLDAVRKFDVRKQVRIESYARHRIRGAMLDSLRSLDNASRDLREKSKRVERAYRDLEARAGQPVDDAKIADELGMSIEGWHHMIRELQAVGANALRPTVSARPKSAVAEILIDNEESPFDRCYRLEQREILKRAIAGLPERERVVISLYYEQPQTMKEIAARLGVDQSRISQLRSAALVRLRKRVNAILRGPLPGVAATTRVASVSPTSARSAS